MKVLITGITGLVGSAIAKKLLLEGYSIKALVRSTANLSKIKNLSADITFIEGDVLDVESIGEALENVDYVVHAAAIVSFAKKERASMYKINVEGTANVVNLCLEKKIKKLCYISSVAALGRPDGSFTQASPDGVLKEFVIDESQLWKESELNSHYAVSKYFAENEVWRAEAEGLNMVILNPSIVLGEGDWHQSSTQLFKYAFNEKPFYTEGYLNYVDVEDVANACYKLLKSNISGERFVLSAGTVSYKDFFSHIAANFNKKAPTFLINSWMLEVIWRVERFINLFSGKTPLITKETAKTSSSRIRFDNKKIKKVLNFEFQDLNLTLGRVCKYLNDRQLNNIVK